MNRGEIYYADLSPVIGSEQGGYRPVLIYRIIKVISILQRLSSHLFLQE